MLTTTLLNWQLNNRKAGEKRTLNPEQEHEMISTDVTDRDGGVQMILFNLDNLSCVKKFLVDGGYSGERFANQVKEICGAQVEVVIRYALQL